MASVHPTNPIERRFDRALRRFSGRISPEQLAPNTLPGIVGRSNHLQERLYRIENDPAKATVPHTSGQRTINRRSMA